MKAFRLPPWLALIFLRLLTGGAWAQSAGDGTVAVPPSLTNAQLRQKALRVQALVETKTVQAHGMIPMFVRATDYALPTAADYVTMAPHRHLRGKQEADLDMPPMHVWRAWENTSADTAFYLAALAYRYRATGDPEVLALCRRTFGAMKHIYELGATDERGFIPKPYGGAYNKQTSSDQVQCFMMGLEAYRQIAPPPDRTTLDEIFRTMADHQIKHNYYPMHGYFAVPSTRELVEGNRQKWTIGLIFVPLLRRAWDATGDPKYLAEIDGWYAGCDVRRLSPAPERAIRGSVAARDFYLPSLMMEIDPANHVLWRSMMIRAFQIARTGILPDGTAYSSWTHDFATGKTTPHDPGFGGGPTRTGRSSIIAWACVTAQRWFPREDMAGLARTILAGLDVDTFRFILPIAAGVALPPDWKTEGELIDHDSLTGWLLAYWEGSWRGYW